MVTESGILNSPSARDTYSKTSDLGIVLRFLLSSEVQTEADNDTTLPAWPGSAAFQDYLCSRVDPVAKMCGDSRAEKCLTIHVHDS